MHERREAVESVPDRVQSVDGRAGTDRPESHDHPQPLERREFGAQMRRARAELPRRRLIRRRCAPQGRRDHEVVEPQTVGAIPLRRLICEPGAIEPLARCITREHAPGPVRSVGAGRKPSERDSRGEIAERRHGLPPVRLIAMRALLRARTSAQ
jgi:hypothetical protein